MSQHHPAKVGDKQLVVPCNIVYYDGRRPLLAAASQGPLDKAFRFNQMSKKSMKKIFPYEVEKEF